MSTNVILSLDIRHQRQDGTYPVVLHLGHKRSSTNIPLKIYIKKNDWDEGKRQVKGSYKGTESVSRLNNRLQKKKSDAMDIIEKLNESGILASLAIVDIKKRILREESSGSFLEFIQTVIDELIQANKLGTARSFKGVKAVLTTFNKEKDIYFSDITFSFLKKFETWHLGKGLGYNGLAVYMRTIRVIINRAIKNGLIEKDSYPFDDYKIKTVPTRKRALEPELLQSVINLKLENTNICFNARNYFVASYMMYGMNFTDMALLRKQDLINGRIQYQRRKTSKLYDIKITPALDEILQHYISLNPESEYVFPIIKRDTNILQDRDILWARKKYNKRLKQVASLCNIEQNLTSYVSRHSFATQAMLLDVPVNAISAMLGHSSLKTTEIYLKSLPSNILDNYNSKILSL